MSEETQVPAIPAITAENLASVARAMKQLLDVREGRIGNRLDANVTFRDLVTAGAVTVRPGWDGRTGNPVIPAWYSDDGYDPTTDTTLPPAPLGFVLTSGLTSIMLQWNSPAYRNHAYAEVWRSPTDVIGNAVLLGTSDTRYFVDAVGSTSTAYYYWVRFVSQANVFGAYNSSTGTLGRTGLVGGIDLTDLIITSAKLATAAVTNDKVETSAITTAKLADLAVDAAKLANSSVTATKIANLAVGTAAIQDAAIVSAKIANLAVGNAAIANLAVTNAKIADLAVDNAKIASLDAAKINTGYLSADRIQAGSLDVKIANISAAVITSGTLNTARIGDASIGFAKIANDIQSSNYVAGSAGWKIDKTGQMEMNNATFRGTLAINNGASSRVEITNSYIKVYDGGALRVQIGNLSA